MSIITLLAAALDAELRVRGIGYIGTRIGTVSRADCAQIMEAVLDRVVAAGSTVAKQRTGENTGQSS